MFRQLERPAQPMVAVTVDGKTVQMPEGANLAAQLLLQDFEPLRCSEVSGQPRSAHCMIGNCFECLAEIDGRRNQQTCLCQVRAGMVVNRNVGN